MPSRGDSTISAGESPHPTAPGGPGGRGAVIMETVDPLRDEKVALINQNQRDLSSDLRKALILDCAELAFTDLDEVVQCLKYTFTSGFSVGVFLLLAQDQLEKDEEAYGWVAAYVANKCPDLPETMRKYKVTTLVTHLVRIRENFMSTRLSTDAACVSAKPSATVSSNEKLTSKKKAKSKNKAADIIDNALNCDGNCNMKCFEDMKTMDCLPLKCEKSMLRLLFIHRDGLEIPPPEPPKCKDKPGHWPKGIPTFPPICYSSSEEESSPDDSSESSDSSEHSESDPDAKTGSKRKRKNNKKPRKKKKKNHQSRGCEWRVECLGRDENRNKCPATNYLYPFLGSNQKKPACVAMTAVLTLILLLSSKQTSELYIDNGEKFTRTMRQRAVEAMFQQRMSSRDSKKFDLLEVDECFVGRRKYGRGGRVRWKTFWILTLTAYEELPLKAGGDDPNEKRRRKIVDRIYYKVPNRERTTLLPLIKKHIYSDRPVKISTDMWSGYKDMAVLLNEQGYDVTHVTVNHTYEYTNADGDHINSAESGHKQMKKAVKTMFGGFGETAATVVRRIEAVLFLSNLPFGKAVWKLLRAIFTMNPELPLNWIPPNLSTEEDFDIASVSMPSTYDRDANDSVASYSASEEDEHPDGIDVTSDVEVEKSRDDTNANRSTTVTLAAKKKWDQLWAKGSNTGNPNRWHTQFEQTVLRFPDLTDTQRHRARRHLSRRNFAAPVSAATQYQYKAYRWDLWTEDVEDKRVLFARPLSRKDSEEVHRRMKIVNADLIKQGERKKDEKKAVRAAGNSAKRKAATAERTKIKEKKKDEPEVALPDPTAVIRDVASRTHVAAQQLVTKGRIKSIRIEGQCIGDKEFVKTWVKNHQQMYCCDEPRPISHKPLLRQALEQLVLDDESIFEEMYDLLVAHLVYPLEHTAVQTPFLCKRAKLAGTEYSGDTLRPWLWYSSTHYTELLNTNKEIVFPLMCASEAKLEQQGEKPADSVEHGHCAALHVNFTDRTVTIFDSLGFKENNTFAPHVELKAKDCVFFLNTLLDEQFTLWHYRMEDPHEHECRSLNNFAFALQTTPVCKLKVLNFILWRVARTCGAVVRQKLCERLGENVTCVTRATGYAILAKVVEEYGVNPSVDEHAAAYAQSNVVVIP